MSQAPASSSMGQSTPLTDSYNFKVIFEAALEAYKKKTKQSLEGHALLAQLDSCDSPAAILDLLRGQVNPNSDEGLKKWLNPTISVLYAFSETLGAAVGLIFSPATVIFAGIGILLLAAKDLNEDQGTLVDIFEQIENFFRRLEIYTKVPPTPAMTDTMVKIMVGVMDILAIATKEIKQSRAKRFLKKLAGRTDMKDALKRLDKLTNEEARMANAQILENTHLIDVKLTGVETQMKNVRGDELRESLIKRQSPPDPSINHNIACDRQHEGTAEWFFRRDIFEEWKVTGSLLWIHGKPGSGKSVLCSAIIENISVLCKGGLSSMAYFYFDFRDIDKQSLSKLLPSLLVQLSAHCDPRRNILSRLYEAHGNSTRQPKDSALVQCLKEMLTLPDQRPIYLILDALDECPNTSVPSARKRVLDLVKDLVGLRLPNLHICVTSRPEVDIRNAIEPLAFHPVSLHDENGQKEDIAAYIRSVVYSDSGPAMIRWRVEEKELVIETLTDKADGMFRWVYCQLAVLQKCLRPSLRQTLGELPGTLDETYERILDEIGKPNGDLARQILQCLAVASRPLRVEELGDILALDFKAAKGRTPELNEDWRSQDRQQDLLITCSSLITIVDHHGDRVVQFSHFSVKEFLMSDRLAKPSRDISSFHILPKSAHTILVQACLAVLLHLDRSIPLLQYAAQHWVGHAQFEKVSSRVQDGMQRLFDPSKPHFAAWLDLHDIEYYESWPLNCSKLQGLPLYYASLCGFHDLAEHLVLKNPLDVNARVGQHRSPLAAALHNRHESIAELLYQHGADKELASRNNETLLFYGHADAVQWLLEHGADVNLRLQKDDYWWYKYGNAKPLRSYLERFRRGANPAIDHGDSPLLLASGRDHFEIMRLLIDRKADVNARDKCNLTPLHLASSNGNAKSVSLLIQHGADLNARDEWNLTPLHRASFNRSTEAMGLLIQHGAYVNARDMGNSTPLHLALSYGRADAAEVLVQHGADVNARDENDWTPLHQAASYYYDPKSVELLIRHGGDVNARNNSKRTPLHIASSSGGAKVMQLLIQHGADVAARDEDDSLPIHLSRNANSLQVLIQHGADVNARDKNGSTPIHLASARFDVYSVWVLIQHGADVTLDVNARDKDGSTLLHQVSTNDCADLIPVLIQHGADINARNKRNLTPLHLALSRRLWGVKIGIVSLLLEHGADADAKDDMGQTPYEIALSSQSISDDITQLILDHRNRGRE